MSESPVPVHEGKLANLDLNLLVSLHALLQERSVTLAAARLGLSQPSLSGSLKRLRRYFDDDLLTRVGNTYELTPFAVELAGKAAIAVDSVSRVFGSESEFDPTAAQREFTVLASDYATTVLGPGLVRLMARAPGVRLNLQLLTGPVVDHAAESLRTVDGMILPHGFLSDLPSQELFTDRWVCVVGRGNTAVGEALTMADLRALPMVLTFHAPTAYTPAAKVLSMLGVSPQVQIVAEPFVAAPFLAAAGDAVALVQERLARRLESAADVRLLECPFDIPPLVEAMWWHPMYQRDAGHQWLRGLFQHAAAALDT